MMTGRRPLVFDENIMMKKKIRIDGMGCNFFEIETLHENY
jgi:hypothetical protein